MKNTQIWLVQINAVSGNSMKKKVNSVQINNKADILIGQ